MAAPLGKGTVLIVDDDRDIVQLIVMALEDEGYQVLTATGEEALQMAHYFLPDMILLDLDMPGMDGVEMSQRLRDDPMTSHIPIVIMPTRSRLFTTARLIPADDRLPKPFEVDDLYDVVARWTRV